MHKVYYQILIYDLCKNHMTSENEIHFNIVDVFAESLFGGNQLAVFHVKQPLSDTEMLKITQEMNYSETSFIESYDPINHQARVRIFTKTGEVPFAGHPTLGTVYVLIQKYEEKMIDKITLDLKGGMIPVNITYAANLPKELWMKQLDPTFYKKHNPSLFAELLRLDLSDIDTRFPIQEVSTGLPFIIVPLKTREALVKSKLEEDKFMDFIKDTERKGVLVFCPEPRDDSHHLASRMFGPAFGIVEDPATGSANGCLAGYLARYRYFDSYCVDVLVEQGYEIGRPSLLSLKAQADSLNAFDYAGKIDVFVGGKCCNVAEGIFYC